MINKLVSSKVMQARTLRTAKLVMIISMLIVVNMSFVNGIGITPGRTSLDLSPNLNDLSANVSFKVVNTDKKDMNVGFTVEGELRDYIKLTEEVVHFSADEDMKTFSYSISLSGDEGLTPGLHTADIVAVELPEDIEDKGMVVRATVSVVTQVYVYVLYPGKHLDASIDVVDKDNEVYFYLPLVSRGNETIDSVRGVISIYDGSGKKVKTFKTNEVSLEPSEKKELSSVWSEASEGKYKAVAEISYDGKIKKVEKEFSLGEDLSVIGVSVKEFKLGSIAKIKILVQNKLSRSVKKAFANLKVFDSNLKEIEDLNSETYEIPASSNKEMIVYWDTEDLEEGLYDSDLRINYDEDFIEKKFKIDVKKDSMSFRGVGFAISSEEGRVSVSNFLYIVIGILVLVNLVWLVVWIRSKKEENKKKDL